MPSTSTLPDDVSLRRQRVARSLRRVWTTLLALFVLAALVGLLGVRSASRTATADGWTLHATYPAITRAGLSVPLRWRVHHDGGFGEDSTVVLRIESDYMGLFDQNGFDPAPASEWSDGTFVYWEFDAPPGGDVMEVNADVSTGAGVQLTRRRGHASVVVDDRPVVSVRLSTWVMP